MPKWPLLPAPPSADEAKWAAGGEAETPKTRAEWEVISPAYPPSGRNGSSVVWCADGKNVLCGDVEDDSGAPPPPEPRRWGCEEEWWCPIDPPAPNNCAALTASDTSESDTANAAFIARPLLVGLLWLWLLEWLLGEGLPTRAAKTIPLPPLLRALPLPTRAIAADAAGGV